MPRLRLQIDWNKPERAFLQLSRPSSETPRDPRRTRTYQAFALRRFRTPLAPADLQHPVCRGEQGKQGAVVGSVATELLEDPHEAREETLMHFHIGAGVIIVAVIVLVILLVR
jgi:hypothetical protein